MSQIADILKAGVEAATGEKVKEVWFEPIGRGAEMQGPSGGWMYQCEDRCEDCLGLNAIEAIKMIVLNARHIAMNEYDEAYRKAKAEGRIAQ